MEHPHDPYHVRPFPQRPKRGGKELISALDQLEKALSEKTPSIENLRAIQKIIHHAANKYNDDRLVNMLRHISEAIDSYEKKPQKATLQNISKELLKVRFELKHL